MATDPLIRVAEPDAVIYTLPMTSLPSSGRGFGSTRTDLRWRYHKGYRTGADDWRVSAGNVGIGWGFEHIALGGGGRLYAANAAGELLFYRHRGFATGARSWLGPKTIKTGFHIRTVDPAPTDYLGFFCDPGTPGSLAAHMSTTLYAVRADGLLHWFRHDGAAEGTADWAGNGVPRTVGNGWVAGNRSVFSGGEGIVYLITDDGTLLWYRHRNPADPNSGFEGPVPVGSGWQQFTDVFSIGGGYIYAVDRDGSLLWYRHEGYQTGVDDWAPRRRAATRFTDRAVANRVSLDFTRLH